MAAAALTPRVRIMAVCDRVRESKTEAAVSSPRPGEYPGYVRVIGASTDRTVFYANLEPRPAFAIDNDLLAGCAQLRGTFPHAGRYMVQIWFFQEQGSDVLKGELPLSLVMDGSDQ